MRVEHTISQNEGPGDGYEYPDPLWKKKNRYPVHKILFKFPFIVHYLCYYFHLVLLNEQVFQTSKM